MTPSRRAIATRWGGLAVAALTLGLMPGDVRAEDEKVEAAPEASEPDGESEEPEGEETPSEAGEESTPEDQKRTPEDEKRAQAREAFLLGIANAKKARWSEALAAFERSSALRPLAVTTYNVGASLRALGRYVQAREMFELALVQHEGSDYGHLSDRRHEDSRAFIEEIDGLVVRLDVRLEPASAALAVDGRPLERDHRPEAGVVMLGGTLPPGPGRIPPAGHFTLELDPGPHVFTMARKGYADSVVNRTFSAGQRSELELAIDKLPASLLISANEERAVVTVNGRDVGQAPLELSRREGDYQVVVEKEGFTPYASMVSLDPGEEMRLRAELKPRGLVLYEEWWFWTAIGVTVSAVAVTTYFVTREPEPIQPNGGTLGWVLEVP